jgi:hypothetical protein
MKSNKNNIQVLHCNQLSIAETIKGKNGRSLYFEWSKFPEESDDCNQKNIAKSYRLGEGF